MSELRGVVDKLLNCEPIGRDKIEEIRPGFMAKFHELAGGDPNKCWAWIGSTLYGMA